jgi:hypothetical protein
MKKIIYLFGFSVGILFFNSSCKKSNEDLPIKIGKNTTLFPATAGEKEIVKKILDVSEKIKNIYKRNPKAMDEVTELIKVGYYKDEFIRLSDLLDPENSSLYKSPKAASILNKGVFKQEFLEELDPNASLLGQNI